MYTGVFDLNCCFIQSAWDIICVPSAFVIELIHIRFGVNFEIWAKVSVVVTLIIGVFIVLCGECMLFGLMCQFISPSMLLALAIQLRCSVFLFDIIFG